MNSPIPTRLPPSLHRFFWDVDPTSINPRKNSMYVINRLLDKGNVDAIRWMLDVYSVELIKKVLQTMRGFTVKSARYWAGFFNVPEGKVICLTPSYLKARSSHWIS